MMINSLLTMPTSLIGAEENDGKYYIKLRNPWGFNISGCGFKGAVTTVNLEEATHVPFMISNLKDD